MSELRYHPFLGTWVITATHRQDRTFLPPPGFNPLAATVPGGFPTEIPLESYDIVVFENKFPSLALPAPDPVKVSHTSLKIMPAHGKCEVVCYSSDPNQTFATLPLSQVRKLTRVWRHRDADLSQLEGVEYVFVFENKGKEIGVTLSHPHGQIYAYPFVPAVVQTELENERTHFKATGKVLMAEILADIEPYQVATNDSWIAFVPPYARYPYEIHVVPKAHNSKYAQLDDMALDLLAEVLLECARKLDRLFGFSMPYVMSLHQAPTCGSHPYTWLRFQFTPIYRTADKMKYLAGSESAMGAFINDTLPEETAKRLRQI